MTSTAPELAVLVPVLGRPHRIRPLLESIADTVPDGSRVVFVCDPSDSEEQRAIEASLHDGEYGPLAVEALLRGGGYAQKINAAVEDATESLLFLGADDLAFQPGWFEAARAKLAGRVEVVGVNDLIDRDRMHSTHFLMTRDYALKSTLDGKQGPCFAGYRAWFCDDELIATAVRRRAYAYCEDAHVEHLHVINGKAVDDATYRRGRSFARQDRRLFRERMRLWT